MGEPARVRDIRQWEQVRGGGGENYIHTKTQFADFRHVEQFLSPTVKHRICYYQVYAGLFVNDVDMYCKHGFLDATHSMLSCK